VNVMVPADLSTEVIDVTAAMFEPTVGHEVLEDVFDEPVRGRTS